jgi:hypothetical protein
MNPKAASKLEHQQASENQPGKLTDLVLLLTPKYHSYNKTPSLPA